MGVAWKRCASTRWAWPRSKVGVTNRRCGRGHARCGRGHQSVGVAVGGAKVLIGVRWAGLEGGVVLTDRWILPRGRGSPPAAPPIGRRAGRGPLWRLIGRGERPRSDRLRGTRGGVWRRRGAGLAAGHQSGLPVGGVRDIYGQTALLSPPLCPNMDMEPFKLLPHAHIWTQTPLSPSPMPIYGHSRL